MNVPMINLTLLTTVSGVDTGFCREIVRMIEARFERMKARSQQLMSDRRWLACYLHLEQYLADLQPYAESTSLKDLESDLKQLRKCEDEAGKERLVRQFLERVQSGLGRTHFALAGRMRSEQTTPDYNASRDTGE